MEVTSSAMIGQHCRFWMKLKCRPQFTGNGWIHIDCWDQTLHVPAESPLLMSQLLHKSPASNPPSLDLHPTFAITSSINSLPSTCFFPLNSIAIPRSLPHLPSLFALWCLAGLPLTVNAKMYCDEMEGGSTEPLEWTQASTCRAACVKRKRGGTVLRPVVSICGV